MQKGRAIKATSILAIAAAAAMNGGCANNPLGGSTGE